MAKKYFCWNVDDGLEQDKKVVEIFRRYGMGATFNLNSGLFGFRQMTEWANDQPLRDVPLEEAPKLPGRFAEHFCIPADEVVQVYEGFEIAGHAYRHENFSKLTEQEILASVGKDKAVLAGMFDQPILGFAYPYGIYSDEAVRCLQELGIRYARTTKTAASFARPADPLRMGMTARHGQPDVFDRLQDFFCAESDEDQFFLMFAHGFEFDFGTPESNWQKLEKICETVAKQGDIVCCSTAQALGLSPV